MAINYIPCAGSNEALVLVMKFENRWNLGFYRKLNKRFNLFYFYALDTYTEFGSQGICVQIDGAAQAASNAGLQLRAVVFDTEYSWFINYIPILKYSRQRYKTGLVVFDEPYLFNINILYASCCDFVLTGCQIAMLKYEEADVSAGYFIMESVSDFDFRDIEPTHDLVFYGQTGVGTRASLIEEARRAGFSVLTSADISPNEKSIPLTEMIPRGKLVLNPMRSVVFPVANHPVWSHIQTSVRWYRQYKGRVFETAWSGRYSITEYCPSTRLLFSETELYMFRTPTEMVEKVRSILSDGDAWRTMGHDLMVLSRDRYSDERLLDQLCVFLREAPKKSDQERNGPI
jgi:hypothetical protein